MMKTPSRQLPPVSAYLTQAKVVQGNESVLMFKRFVLAVLVFALAALMLASVARAEEDTATQAVPPETIEAMQSVIRGQISAFQADDAEAAYAYASPGIQQRFANPTRFAAMVRQSYSTVFEHQSFSFIEEAITPAGPAQRVEFVSEDGQVWGGIYTFVEAEDGQLFISGVVLRRQNALHL